MAGVETTHTLYDKRKTQWTLIRDCLEGEDAIKAKGVTYLPKTKGMSDLRYEAFKLRAEWVNYTKRTLTGLHGLVFRKKPVINYPKELQDIVDNCDRRGTNLYKFASNTFKDSLPVSFGGLLVDQPVVNEFISRKEAEERKINPFIKYYAAESVINWKTSVKDGVEYLSLIVLKETYEDETEDEFVHNEKIQYRVLSLYDGIYTQRLFRQGSNGNFTDVQTIPVTVDGKSINYIPFFFLYEQEPVTPFMLDLAKANISHYRKSADYENGVHLTTIPTGYVTGHRQATYQNAKGEEEGKEVVKLGEDEFLFFEEEGAKVGTLCYAGEGLTHSEHALETSMSNMAILGSRLIVSEKGTSESADSAKIHRAGENASLADMANCVADAFTQALQTIAKWKGLDEEVSVEFCTDYDTLAFDANALNAVANLKEAKSLPLPYVFEILKNGEYTSSAATFKEYALLLDMEDRGYSPSEIAEQYEAIRQGKVVTLKDKKTADNSEDKKPSETPENTEISSK